MREIVHVQAGQCGNQIGAKVSTEFVKFEMKLLSLFEMLPFLRKNWRVRVWHIEFLYDETIVIKND